MAGHYLKEVGYGHVSINVPLAFYIQVDKYIETQNETRIEFYSDLLRDFLEGVTPSTRYLATKGESQTRSIPMWIAPEVFLKLKELSKREQISLRSICFTALFEFFEKKERILIEDAA